jgi:hypothetical protein
VLADPHGIHQEGEARPLKTAVAPVAIEGGDGRAEGGGFGPVGWVFLGHERRLDAMGG